MKTIKNLAIALVAFTFLTTSCLDNTEPAGIASLRGAKSEYLKAQALVQQAQASLITAQAATENARAKQEEAIASKMEYEAQVAKIDAELAQANSQAEIERLAREKEKFDAILKTELEQANAALLYAQASTQTAQQNYLNAIAQLNILKTIGIPEAYKSTYDNVYSKLTAAWNMVDNLQYTLVNTQQQIQYFDNYSYANQILDMETNIASKALSITSKEKALADYKLLNGKSIDDQKALLTGYQTKLTAAIASLATLNNSIATQANALNDIYIDLNTKNNAYSLSTLFTYKLAVPLALQAQYGKEVAFISGEDYFNSTSKTIYKYDVTLGAKTLVSFNTKVYEYKDQAPTNAAFLSYSPEYWKNKILGVQELADQNANLAALLKTKNDKEDAYKGATNGNLKAWQDAVTAYNANSTLAANITNLNNTSDAVWGSQLRTNQALGRTIAVDAVWNPVNSMFEDKNSSKTFSLNPNSTASYIAYVSAKYNHENLQTVIANQTDIKKLFEDATQAMKTINTNVMAISNPIKTANDDYIAKGFAISSSVSSKVIASAEVDRYNTLINNINSGVTSYEGQITVLTKGIADLNQDKKELEEVLAEFKLNPDNGVTYIELLRKKVVEYQAQIDNYSKSIATYTTQLSTLLEYINGTK